MSDDYTPTTAEVRQDYSSACGPFDGDQERKAAEFDRWLAKHDASIEPTGLLAEVDRLQAALDRVREVHQPIDAAAISYHPYRSCQVCIGCGQDDGNWQQWPCPTIRAIESGESDE